jgi:hypothetical protein
MSAVLELEFPEMPPGFDPSAEIATEVLAADLGDFYGPDDIVRHAGAWEAVNQRPLKLPIEMESWAQYAKRKKLFKVTRPYMGDPATLAEDVESLLRADEPAEPEALKTHRKRIHDLEDALGRKRTDFSVPRVVPANADAVSLSRFKAIVDIETWTDRVASVGEERDIGCLNLLSMRDPREEVRGAAMSRILELQIK